MSFESEEKEFRLGMWAGLIGGIMLTITGIVGLIDFGRYITVAILLFIPYILTLLWGIIALFGAALLYRGNIMGDYLLIFSGSLAVFGMFWPLAIYELDSGIFIINLSYHFGYVDPFIVLLGGILDLLVRKEIILS